ncbi:TetR family transcriptional regulator [Altererythrobacter aerius]|uniref:TetR family transcriptional regulator n=1 Tax=Tsuneonella aeria TaxID=1837929 RepID=A0A6I4TAE0_9SPHN|nr:TetR/AcrR family transcriptional regulator [Tsuneonella aeria]MXO74281.1 TetR family transcriptional regulator [Tsuneonella aeria]
MGEGMRAGETGRFERRRQDVIQAASELINELGVKGTTFAELAQRVGLNATSITYYFDRKDKLVTAVYEATLDWMEHAARTAAAQAEPADRLRAFIAAHVALRRRIRAGERGLITALSEIRTLEEGAQRPLLDQYSRIVGHVRAFFGDERHGLQRAVDTARAHILLEAMFWWPVWSLRYSTRDFDRLEERIFDVLAHGLAGTGQGWAPRPLDNRAWRGERDGEGDTVDAFLRAATVMINQRGYRGASVNRIAAALNVTKGSFYHHHSAKDDLVFACFERSYDRLSAVQLAACEAGGDGWSQIASALAELVDLQFHDAMPLLRTAALQALPSDERGSVVVRSNRLANRFAGMLADGIADGSVRAVDPLVASQLIMPALNAAYEARGWAARQPDPALAVKLYAWTLCAGVFTDPPEVR